MGSLGRVIHGSMPTLARSFLIDRTVVRSVTRAHIDGRGGGAASMVSAKLCSLGAPRARQEWFRRAVAQARPVAYLSGEEQAASARTLTIGVGSAAWASSSIMGASCRAGPVPRKRRTSDEAWSAGRGGSREVVVAMVAVLDSPTECVVSCAYRRRCRGGVRAGGVRGFAHRFGHERRVMGSAVAIVFAISAAMQRHPVAAARRAELFVGESFPASGCSLIGVGVCCEVGVWRE